MGILDGIIEFDRQDRYHSDDHFQLPILETRYDDVVKNIIAHFTEVTWATKRVLDYGCGSGGFGRRFVDLGAAVTFLDGREGNLKKVQALLPNAKTVLLDLESTENYTVEYSDLALFMGTLYHLGEPLQALKAISATADNICLETACLDHDGTAIVFFKEPTDPTGRAINDVACRTSPRWIDEALAYCGFTFVKDISKSIKNFGPEPGITGYLYDWEIQRTCGWRRDECSLRRMWIASKSRETSIFREFTSS